MMDDFYKNTNKDRKAYNRFKMICYIPIYGLIERHYALFLKEFCTISPMSFDEKNEWESFDRRVHLLQGIYIISILFLII